MSMIDDFVTKASVLALELGIHRVVISVKTLTEGARTVSSPDAASDPDIRRSIAAKCNLTVPEDRIPEVGWGEPG